MHKNVLIPVSLDHEGLAARKIDCAKALMAPDGKITLLTVLENVPGFVAEFVTVKLDNSVTGKVLEKMKGVAGDDPAIACAVVLGKPGVEIARFAEENGMDLIVVGSHHPSAQDYFLGSTASRVVRRAPCSVYVMR